MAGAWVKENGHGANTTGDGSTITSAFVNVASAPAAGNTLFLFFAAASSDPLADWSVSDPKGNTWIIDVLKVGTVHLGFIARTAQDHGTLALNDHVTVTTTGAGFDVRALWLEEFSGLLTPSSIDKTASNSGTAASAPTGTTAATTQAAEVALAFCATHVNSAITKDASYTAFTTGSTGITDPLATSDKVTGFPTFKVLTATGTQSATYTMTSTAFVAMIATYKAVVSTNGNASGALGTLTLSSPTGSAAGGSTTSGSLSTLSFSTPSASAIGGASPSSALGTLTLSSPTSSATGDGSGVATPGTLTLNPPTSSAQGDANTAGALDLLALASPNATATGGASSLGSTPVVVLLAPAGSAVGFNPIGGSVGEGSVGDSTTTGDVARGTPGHSAHVSTTPGYTARGAAGRIPRRTP